MRAQGNTVGPDFVHLQVSHPYVHEVEQEWLDDEGQDAHTGAHERTAGRGKPRRDAPVVGQGAGRAGEDPQDPVGADSGGPGSPDLARALVEHPKVQGELSKLPKPVQKAYDDRLDLLRSGQTHSSTHPLSGPLKGWQGTALNWQYRMVHRNIGNAVHVLSVGNHDESYDAAIRRKASRFTTAACGCVFDGPSFTGCDHLAKLGGQEAMRHIAAARKQAVQDPPEGLRFEHTTSETGGSKWPVMNVLRAYKPDVDSHVGELAYLTHPRRQGILVDGLTVGSEHQRQGIGSALMDEMQRRHPGPINHGDRTDDGKAWWSGYTQGKPVRRGRTAGQRTAAEDYWMNHRPGGPSEEEDGTAAPAHALDRVFPADVYTHPHYYGSGDVTVPGGGNALRETAQTIKRIRGNPDAPVTMYRALPPEHAHKGFRVGDWVSIHPTYAQTHGLHPEDENKDWPVIKATVPAQHLWNDGNSIDEFGYHGPPVHGEIHYPGGAESAAIVRRQPKQAALPGVEYRHGTTWTGNPNVTAHLPSGERIGEMGWDPETKKIGWVAVYDEEHRRQGIASGMLAKAREADPEVRHGDLDDPEAFTDAGRAWARHVGAHQVLYHGSLTPFEPGTVLTPEGRDPEGSIHSGDWVYATTSPEAARYFGSMHDSSPNSDTPVHVHRVEPIGDVEPDHFLGEHEEFSRGNVKAKALRVLDRQQMPGHWAHTAMGMAGPDYEGLTFQVRRNWSSEVGEDEKWLDGNDKHDRRSFHGMMAFIPGREQSVGTLEYSPYKWAEDDKEVHLHGLRVDPEHQRRGVGRALMNEVMRRYPDTPINHGIKTEQGEAFTRATQGVESPKIDNPGRSQTYGEAPYAEHWTLGGKPYDPKTKQVTGALAARQMLIKPSLVWDHIRTDLRPHRLQSVTDSIREHGFQPDWDHADGPIRVTLGDSPSVSNGSHRLRALRDLGIDDPIPMHVTSSAAEDIHGPDYVTVYRGLHFGPMDEEERARLHAHPLAHLNTAHGVGIHWSQDSDSAYNFATGRDVEGYDHDDFGHFDDEDESVHPSGMVLQGQVHKRHLIDPDSQEGRDYADNYAILGEHHPENETTIRHDAPVHLTHIHTVTNDPEGYQDEIHTHELGNHRVTAKLDLHQVRVLNPTTGHDPDLFDGEDLKAEVRRDLIHRWTVFCARNHLANWHAYTELYFTGGEASEWSGPGSNPNGDFDMQVGLDFDEFRAVNAAWKGLSDAEVSAKLNDLFWTQLNDHDFHPAGTERTFDLTWFSNPAVNPDISAIRPYAAWNVLREEWAVHPRHYTRSPQIGPAMRKALDGAERYARQILALPEPQRTREAAALFNSWHEDRNLAFGPGGAGVFDYANLRMKALEATGTWQELQAAANRLAKTAAQHAGPHFHGTAAELQPGDLIEPGKYAPTRPDPDIRGEDAESPREHAYFTPNKRYISEYYGPNLYEVEPTGPFERDPEYGSRRDMFRSRHPLRVVRQVSHSWGIPKDAANRLAPRAAAGRKTFDQLAPHEQEAVSLYHEQMKEEGFAAHDETPHAYHYETRQEPKAEFLKRYMDADNDFKAEYGPDDWEAHHAETLATHPIPHYPAHNRWPLIVNDDNPNYVDDGYHRMHSYMRDGATHIPTVRMHWAGGHEARLAPRAASYGDYLRGGGLDQVADRVYDTPQHHPGDEWHTNRFPGSVGWVGIEHMLPLRHHDGTQNGRSPEVTQALTEGFQKGEGWLSPLQLNYSAEAHKAWLGEGNHRLEAARRAGLTHVPVTIAHVRGTDLHHDYQPAPFPQKIHSYSELKALRGTSGDTIHPKHVLPADWLLQPPKQ